MDKSRNTILYICSWLDHESLVGNFFVEQGELFKEDFNIVFLVFKRVSVRDFFLFKSLFAISTNYTENGSLIIYANYPYFLKFGFKALSIIQKFSVRKVFKFLKKRSIRVNIIHAQSLIEAGLFSYYFYQLYSIPYVLTEHNQIAFLKKRVYTYKVLDSVLFFSKYNLVVSNAKIQQFASNDLFYDFKVVGNLVNDKIFKIYNNKSNYIFVEKRILKIISIGVYSLIKDQETIFRALSVLDKYSVNIEFTWVGFNSWNEDNFTFVDRLISKYAFKTIKLNLVPFSSRVDVADLLRNSDLFILSSLAEGLSVSLLEALACGLPVFSTYCGGSEDVINEKNGRLFPIRDFNALSVLIFSFYKGELIFDSESISTDIISRFGCDRFYNNLKSIYAQVI